MTSTIYLCSGQTRMIFCFIHTRYLTISVLPINTVLWKILSPIHLPSMFLVSLSTSTPFATSFLNWGDSLPLYVTDSLTSFSMPFWSLFLRQCLRCGCTADLPDLWCCFGLGSFLYINQHFIYLTAVEHWQYFQKHIHSNFKWPLCSVIINLTFLILYFQLQSPVHTTLTYLEITLLLVFVQSSAVTPRFDCPE